MNINIVTTNQPTPAMQRRKPNSKRSYVTEDSTFIVPPSGFIPHPTTTPSISAAQQQSHRPPSLALRNTPSSQSSHTQSPYSIGGSSYTYSGAYHTSGSSGEEERGWKVPVGNWVVGLGRIGKCGWAGVRDVTRLSRGYELVMR